MFSRTITKDMMAKSSFAKICNGALYKQTNGLLTKSTHCKRHFYNGRSNKFLSATRSAKYTVFGALGVACTGYSLYHVSHANGVPTFPVFFSNNVIKLESLHKSFSSSSKAQDSDSSQNITILPTNVIESKLHGHEYSYAVQRQDSKIQRFDVSQLPSNDPIEDNHVEQILTDNGNDIWFYGVFDGHGGPYTSAKLTKDLIPYVAHYLSPVLNDFNHTQEEINSGFQKAFVQLDNDIVLSGFKNLFESPTRETLLQKVLPAISGSCCLLTMYDTKKSVLTVAITGDSRALLVSEASTGPQEKSENNWIVRALTKDQTAEVPEEIERIRNEHPSEETRTCIYNGRVLGSLQPSRAFGDYRYKIDGIGNQKFNELPPEVKMFLRKTPRHLRTPPYVTAEPVVTSCHIDPLQDKFMIIASDGLYELLNNDEIASLAINWYKSNTSGNGEKAKVHKFNIQDSDKLNRDLIHDSRYKTGLPQIMADENCSTHIIRNALSCGGQKEYVDTFVSIPSPMSRKYRDDLTVTVVFFGDSQDPITSTHSTGSSTMASASEGVSLIEKATTPLPKPKL